MAQRIILTQTIAELAPPPRRLVLGALHGLYRVSLLFDCRIADIQQDFYDSQTRR